MQVYIPASRPVVTSQGPTPHARYIYLACGVVIDAYPAASRKAALHSEFTSEVAEARLRSDRMDKCSSGRRRSPRLLLARSDCRLGACLDGCAPVRFAASTSRLDRRVDPQGKDQTPQVASSLKRRCQSEYGRYIYLPYSVGLLQEESATPPPSRPTRMASPSQPLACSVVPPSVGPRGGGPLAFLGAGVPPTMRVSGGNAHSLRRASTYPRRWSCDRRSRRAMPAVHYTRHRNCHVDKIVAKKSVGACR
jgi:hypothetical protein